MAQEPQPSKYSWTEPESDYKAEYPFNNVTQTESGHFMEFDDTPGAERVRIQHRTGTYTEIQADGTRVNKIVGDNYEIVAANNNVMISGICNLTVEGDCVVNIQGNKYERVTGDYFLEVQGNYETKVDKKTYITSGDDIRMVIAGLLGKLSITADSVKMNSDLNVEGDVTVDSLYSDSSVYADTGMHAGLAGISTLGGIAAGFPQAPAIPGKITAATMVEAPLISGIIVKDIVSDLNFMRFLYDVHIHPHPRGPTGLPVPLM